MYSVMACSGLKHGQLMTTIGGFNQRQGEALPPQILLTLKFVVWAKLRNDENYQNLPPDVRF